MINKKTNRSTPDNTTFYISLLTAILWNVVISIIVCWIAITFEQWWILILIPFCIRSFSPDITYTTNITPSGDNKVLNDTLLELVTIEKDNLLNQHTEDE